MPGQFVEVVTPPSKNSEQNPRYTGSPWQLLTSDVRLFFRNILYLPLIFLPLAPWPSGPLCELYPSPSNILDILFHCVLFVLQIAFLISLPLLFYIPFGLFISYFVIFLVVNYVLCFYLNGGIPKEGLKSTENEQSENWTKYDDECWIFLNGICVGKNWLQNNVDRLSRTFHRPILGVHNSTYGVVFDIIQCLIQRSMLYATSDVRECYMLVKKALYRKGVKRVVFILHSQGGIEGGMIVDWLLNEVPQDLLQYLEIYTFGSIANHFNNPYRQLTSHGEKSGSTNGGLHMTSGHDRAIRHIEHYANRYDFASRFGVLNFIKDMPKVHLENRFMGRVFVNPRAGHQLNQHYLDTIFPLDESKSFTRDPREGDFMISNASVREPGHFETKEGSKVLHPFSKAKDHQGDAEILNLSPVLTSRESVDREREMSINGAHRRPNIKVCDLSRLWQYRNGGRPRLP